MIYVDRNAVPVPKAFRSALAQEERARAIEEALKLAPASPGAKVGISDTARVKAQEGVLKAREWLRSDFATKLWRDARPALRELFHDKCAYCETPLKNHHGDIELYRPRANARNLDGSVDPLHYFWLALEWENTLIACALCNRGKGSRFPVQGERVAFGVTQPEELAAELPLLINPCLDQPSEHLAVYSSGVLLPLSERGKYTIEVLNLNRKELIEERGRRWNVVQMTCEKLLGEMGLLNDTRLGKVALEAVIKADSPFCLAAQHAAFAFVREQHAALLQNEDFRALFRDVSEAKQAPSLPDKNPESVWLEEAIERGKSGETQPHAGADQGSTTQSFKKTQRQTSGEPSLPRPKQPPATKHSGQHRDQAAESLQKKSSLDFGWLLDRIRRTRVSAPADMAALGDSQGSGAPSANEPGETATASAKDVLSDWIVELEQSKRNYSIEDEDQRTRIAYFTSAKRIERFTIRNFKAIEEISLEFPKPEADRESWLMLLGENGCGKSSILQALALTLMGQDHANSLGLDARRYVRRDPEVSSGEVIAELSGVGTIRLEFSRDSSRFRVTPPDPKVLLLGYGATRLLPKMVGRESSARTAIRILNLFDPTAPLADTEAWLLDRDKVSEEKFDTFREDITRLLMLPDDTRMYRDNGQIEMDYFGTRKALRDMSDGFQSIIALAGDISIGVNDWWGGLREAEGIVLLDEIEVHLHPTWKISIVERLRETCPHLSFIVTTHDPLCLKGLRSEEIVVLRKTGEREVEVIRDIPRIDHLRADQLLGSFLFNLPSTRGSGTAVAIARYSVLLGKAARSELEEQELTQLREQLDSQLSSALTPEQKKVERAVLAALSPEAIGAGEDVARLEVLRQLQEFLSAEEPL